MLGFVDNREQEVQDLLEDTVGEYTDKELFARLLGFLNPVVA
jgi:hypothetical protein